MEELDGRRRKEWRGNRCGCLVCLMKLVPDLTSFLVILAVPRQGDISDSTELIFSAPPQCQSDIIQFHCDGTNKGFTVVERFRFPLIQTQQCAVHLTPKGHAELPARLNNLEISFQSRFQRTGYLPDISEAIQNQQRATQLTPDGHADLLVLSGVPFTSMIDHLHYRRS